MGKDERTGARAASVLGRTALRPSNVETASLAAKE